MKAISAVFAKELQDHVRDRRSLFTALLSPLLGPVILGVLLTLLASWQREGKQLEVPVVGKARAPNLVAFLERYGAKVTDAPGDYEQKVRDGELDLAVVIGPDYGKQLEEGHSAELTLVVDSSRNQAIGSVRRVRRLLDGYGDQLGKLRLLARGVSPELAAPVKIDELELATTAKLAGNLLNMVPYFLLMAAFFGAMHVAIDATAGERERGSLEALLLNPVARAELVVGKWLTAVLSGWVGVTAALVAFMLVLRRVPLEDLGLRTNLGGREFAASLAIFLPLTLMTAALQMLVATYARSFKEAQSYIQLLVLVPSIPGMLIAFTNLKPKAWMMAVPTFGQQLLAADAMRGEPVKLGWLAISIAAAIASAALCLVATSRLLGKEKIVFGRG